MEDEVQIDQFDDELPQGKYGTTFIYCQEPEASPTTEIDLLLHNSMIGFSFDREFENGRLPDDHQYSWQSFQRDPKADKGELESRGSWFRTMKYHVLHTGGFVRLCTARGRAYWNAQNETGHITPDWKLHFSCELEDLGRAWDILAALFIEAKMEIGMKATIIEEGGWSAGQRGRELTVYIFKFDPSYQGYMQGIIEGMDHELHLGVEWEGAYEAPFWYSFIVEAERRLFRAGIRSRGCANGDLAMPNCRYASLRNEAFVDGIYPPNDRGWNAANQRNPFLDVIFFLRAAAFTNAAQ